MCLIIVAMYSNIETIETRNKFREIAMLYVRKTETNHTWILCISVLLKEQVSKKVKSIAAEHSET